MQPYLQGHSVFAGKAHSKHRAGFGGPIAQAACMTPHLSIFLYAQRRMNSFSLLCCAVVHNSTTEQHAAWPGKLQPLLAMDQLGPSPLLVSCQLGCVSLLGLSPLFGQLHSTLLSSLVRNRDSKLLFSFRTMQRVESSSDNFGRDSAFGSVSFWLPWVWQPAGPTTNYTGSCCWHAGWETKLFIPPPPPRVPPHACIATCTYVHYPHTLTPRHCPCNSPNLVAAAHETAICHHSIAQHAQLPPPLRPLSCMRTLLLEARTGVQSSLQQKNAVALKGGKCTIVKGMLA
jgi:hypothetical protein